CARSVFYYALDYW
nr:immunoglobulin heavy chain junction region [Mus musculus]